MGRQCLQVCVSPYKHFLCSEAGGVLLWTVSLLSSQARTMVTHLLWAFVGAAHSVQNTPATSLQSLPWIRLLAKEAWLFPLCSHWGTPVELHSTSHQWRTSHQLLAHLQYIFELNHGPLLPLENCKTFGGQELQFGPPHIDHGFTQSILSKYSLGWCHWFQNMNVFLGTIKKKKTFRIPRECGNTATLWKWGLCLSYDLVRVT